MDNLISDILKAQGMTEHEMYGRLSTYYQMLAEGCSRTEARTVFRPDSADAYLRKLVSTAVRSIIEKGFHPEEVEDAIMRYYHPSLPMFPFPGLDRVSDFPLDPQSPTVEDELGSLISEDRCEG